MSNTSKIDKNRGQFQKGKEKTGGRKKGTPNKRTAELQEILGEFNPAEKLMELYNKPTTKDDLKVLICKELMKYIYPQRKAVDTNITGGGFIVEINNEAVEVEQDNV
jgi:hypothetical protein